MATVYVVESRTPNFCECETPCNCASDDFSVSGVFSTLKKAEKFVADHPKEWRGGTSYSIEKHEVDSK